MADAVTSQTLFDGSKNTIRKFTNVSDGTGESDVQKVDISGLTGAPSAVRILQAWWVCSGMDVRLIFDHTTDDIILTLSGDGYMDFREIGGIPDPASSGGTGDILFTTFGHTSGDSYMVILDIGIS